MLKIEIRETEPCADLDLVGAGMKWDRNYVSKNVIDARGRDIATPFGTFTRDVHGAISSFTPRI